MLRLRSLLHLVFVSMLLPIGSAGCADENTDDFNYGRDEMRTAIEGTWEGTSRVGPSGPETPMKMKLAYVAPDARPLCGNRVLTLGPRCMDISSINVIGTVNARPDPADAEREVATRGTFDVMSLRFDGSGALRLDVEGRTLDAMMNGDVLEGTLAAQVSSSAISFSLRRRK